MSATSTRINLAMPLDLAILVERECDRRGIKAPQYIKEAVFEKVRRSENKEEQEENDINKLREDLNEIKRTLLVVTELVTKNK
jgi:hypothetical protein